MRTPSLRRVFVYKLFMVYWNDLSTNEKGHDDRTISRMCLLASVVLASQESLSNGKSASVDAGFYRIDDDYCRGLTPTGLLRDVKEAGEPAFSRYARSDFKELLLCFVGALTFNLA